MKIHRCKGTRDLSPEEMRRFRFIEGIFRESCLKWGYEEVRTSTIEHLHLFTATGTLTPSRLRRVYSFLDWDGWSGERVVLRPDGTIPIARMYIESMADRELAKLFYVTDVFSFEGTGEERRERWQCGAELIGAGSATADAELVVLALEVLARLGLKGVELRLSHAGLIRTLLGKFGLTHERQTAVFDRLLDGDLAVLADLKPERPELGRALATLLELKGKSAGFLRNVMSSCNDDFPEIEAPIKNFVDVVERLESVGCDYRIDMTSGRGFEYYTGLIFRLFVGDNEVGGGGRYDALIPLLGGQNTPASGFALYLEGLMNLIAPEMPVVPSSGKVLVRTETKKARDLKEVFDLIKVLHRAGYQAEVDLRGRKAGAAKWLIEIRSKTPRYVLTDPVHRRRLEAESGREVLALLGKGKRRTAVRGND